MSDRTDSDKKSRIEARERFEETKEWVKNVRAELDSHRKGGTKSADAEWRKYKETGNPIAYKTARKKYQEAEEQEKRLKKRFEQAKEDLKSAARKWNKLRQKN